MASGNQIGKDPWLEEGYRQFAEFGPNQLSINHISKAVSSSRASFYHHFGAIDLFIDELLQVQWILCEQFNALGKETCDALYPDLYNLLGNYTLALKFNLQLFHHRQEPRFNFLFMKTYEATAQSFALDLFADHYQLKQPRGEINNLWRTLGEAWYARLDPNDLAPATLQGHAEEIMETMSGFMNSPLYSRLHKIS